VQEERIRRGRRRGSVGQDEDTALMVSSVCRRGKGQGQDPVPRTRQDRTGLSRTQDRMGDAGYDRAEQKRAYRTASHLSASSTVCVRLLSVITSAHLSSLYYVQ
jgi:hypothetical protein